MPTSDSWIIGQLILKVFTGKHWNLMEEESRTRKIEECVRFYRCPTDAATIADTTTDINWDSRMFLADIVKDEFFFKDIEENEEILEKLTNPIREDLDLEL